MKGAAKVTVVGAGAREDAIVQRLMEEGSEVDVVLTRANDMLAGRVERSVVVTPEVGEVAAACAAFGPSMVIAQDEHLLGAGLSEGLAPHKIQLFGASREQAELELDKRHGLSLMRKLTPKLVPATTEVADLAGLADALAQTGLPLIARAAAAREATPVIVENEQGHASAFDVLSSLLKRSPLLLQPYLTGEPFTLYVLTDGRAAHFLPPVRSYPWLGEDDVGPKTGGMGSLTSNPERLAHLPEADLTVAQDAVRAVLEELRTRGRPYVSVLGAEFLQTSDGPRFIEFDCRFGDPEIINNLQVLATPLLDVIAATLSGDLVAPELRSSAGVALALVPDHYPFCGAESMVELPQPGAFAGLGLDVFYGNLRQGVDGDWIAGDSRSLVVAAAATSIDRAVDRVYTIEGLSLAGLTWRRDIGGSRVTEPNPSPRS
jgi:phosphoribosylamine--glycine ligase